MFCPVPRPLARDFALQDGRIDHKKLNARLYDFYRIETSASSLRACPVVVLLRSHISFCICIEQFANN